MTTMTVNNEIIENEVQDDLTINQVMDFIQQNYIKEDEFFTEVKVNGKAVSEAEENQVLGSSINDFETIDFTVRNSVELAFDALDTCTRHLDSLISKVEATAVSYRENKIEKANQQFIETTDILNLFIELITSIHQTLRVNSETKLPTGKTLQELEMHLLSVLKAMVPAKEKGDVIMLCDLLEYELVDNLTQWKITAIPELKRLKSA